jgi:isoquinoline 1-oxidoreductase alpha subunit
MPVVFAAMHFLDQMTFMAAHAPLHGVPRIFLPISASRRINQHPHFGSRHDQEKVAMAVSFTLNGKPTTLDVDPNMPLLWAIREAVGLTGTKFGCGVAQCGACTVHLEGQAIRSCVTPVSAIAGQNVVTIEGLSSKAANAVQTAWRKLDVVQCGYCQSGQIMAAAALLASHPVPDDHDIDAAMSGNVCRCGTYQRIRSAIHHAAGSGRR